MHIPRYDEHQAAVATAEATWALFWVTGAAALATFLAVIAAFLVPAVDRRVKKERFIERKKRQDAAKAEIIKTFAFLKEIERKIAANEQLQDHELWTLLNRINISRRTLEYWLTIDLGDEAYPTYILKAVQALYEVRDACDGLLPGHNWATHVSGREIAVRIIRRARDRCKKATSIPGLGWSTRSFVTSSESVSRLPRLKADRQLLLKD